jgi:hypothetical protein
MGTIFPVVQPLARIRPSLGLSVNILDVDFVIRVHFLAGGTSLIFTELKLSVLESDALIPRSIVGALEAQSLAVLAGEQVTFS